MDKLMCTQCQGACWVCEEHSEMGWPNPNGEDCCIGPGVPCPKCNTNIKGVYPRMPDDFETLVDSTGYHRPPKLVK